MLLDVAALRLRLPAGFLGLGRQNQGCAFPSKVAFAKAAKEHQLKSDIFSRKHLARHLSTLTAMSSQRINRSKMKQIKKSRTRKN